MVYRRELLAPFRVAYLRGTGPYPKVLPGLWKRLHAAATAQKLFGPSAVRLTACWDDPAVVPADALRSDVCLGVDADYQPTGELAVQTLGGGEYDVARYVGPYEGLGGAWGAFTQHLKAAGRGPFGCGPCLEFYRNTPATVVAAELVTELYAPVGAA